MMIAASRFKTHIGKLIPTPARMYWVMFGRKRNSHSQIFHFLYEIELIALLGEG
jgi:hypothetical protein